MAASKTPRDGEKWDLQFSAHIARDPPTLEPALRTEKETSPLKCALHV